VSAPHVAFIGAGNMARALIGGLIKRGTPPGSLHVADPASASRASLLAACPGVDAHEDNEAAAALAPVWVLAVKPQQLAAVARALAPLAARSSPLVVSVAAGIPLAQLTDWLGQRLPIVRAMPNRPALIGAGVTALYAPASVDRIARAKASTLLEAVGRVVWLTRESQMDAVTAVSASGPAYFFRLIELLEAAAIDEGLPAELARTLAVETARGAGLLAAQGEFTPAVLCEQVASPGGTTAAALAELEAADLRAIVSRAVRAGVRRAQELAEDFAGGPPPKAP
jgi:pyrroline-5-carboxylate reductase